MRYNSSPDEKKKKVPKERVACCIYSYSLYLLAARQKAKKKKQKRRRRERRRRGNVPCHNSFRSFSQDTLFKNVETRKSAQNPRFVPSTLYISLIASKVYASLHVGWREQKEKKQNTRKHFFMEIGTNLIIMYLAETPHLSPWNIKKCKTKSVLKFPGVSILISKIALAFISYLLDFSLIFLLV